MSAQAASGYYVSGVIGFAAHTVKQNRVIAAPNPHLSILPAQRLVSQGKGNAYPIFGIRMGKVMPLSCRWSLSYGIGFYVNRPQANTGDYYQVATQAHPDGHYRYTLSTQQLMAEARVHYQLTNQWSAFVGGGAGIGRVMTSPMAVNSQTVGPPVPASKTHLNTGGAFALSFGADYTLTSVWSIGATVSKLWLGKSALLVGNGEHLVEISQGQLDPWQAQLSMTYHFS